MGHPYGALTEDDAHQEVALPWGEVDHVLATPYQPQRPSVLCPGVLPQFLDGWMR
jgi:hypothetical protein